MHHAKWNFNVLLSRATLFPVSLVAVTLIFSGCQNSNDDYQIITEEMSQPVPDETSVAESGTENSAPLPSPEVSSSEMNDVPESETPQLETTQSEPATVATTEQVTTPQETEPIEVPTEKPTIVTPVEIASASAPQQPSPEGNLGGLINLQEEMARQKRLLKLGLGQNAEPSEPREIKLLVKEHEFIRESSQDAWRVTYDDLDLLKILNMEPVPLDAQEYLPNWLTALDGKKVILRGWMYPTMQTKGLKGFIFVRDNNVCCFGPNAKAYDKLIVRLKKGSSTKYIQGRPFDVVGTFKLETWIEDERDMRTGKFIEKLGMLYHIEDAVVVD